MTRPYDCKTFKQICAQESDNAFADDFWILTDGHTVTLKKLGKPCRAQIDIPRGKFNKLVDWYMRSQAKDPKP
jgi:hypothetical protein